jgi:hypothetical protein
MRKTAFADSFYPGGSDELLRFIEGAMASAEVSPKPVESAVAYVSPHAGYAYSGKTAAYTYKAMQCMKDIDSIESVVIVGPNHTGVGAPIAVSTDDWETPIGVAKNDTALSNAIASTHDVYVDEDAHRDEHSIEVQLPFLKHALPGKRFCFVCLGDQSIEASELLAGAILNASRSLGRKVIVLASSDFDHYEPAEIAEGKDSRLLEALKHMDHATFNRLVEELGDSICGFGPITTAMMFAKEMGAGSGVVLKYSNSGDATGDYSSVVAYASLAFV